MVGLRVNELSSPKGPLLWGKKAKPTPKRPRRYGWGTVAMSILIVAIPSTLLLMVSHWLS